MNNRIKLAFFAYATPLLTLANTYMFLRIGGIEIFGEFVLASTILAQVSLIAKFGIPSYLVETFAENPSINLQNSFGTIAATAFILINALLYPILARLSMVDHSIYIALFFSSFIYIFILSEPFVRFAYGLTTSKKLNFLKSFILSAVLALCLCFKGLIDSRLLIAIAISISAFIFIFLLKLIEKAGQLTLILEFNAQNLHSGILLLRERGLYSSKILVSGVLRDSILSFDIYIASVFFPPLLGPIGLFKRIVNGSISPFIRILFDYIQKHTWSSRQSSASNFKMVVKASFFSSIVYLCVISFLLLYQNFGSQAILVLNDLDMLGPLTLALYGFNMMLSSILELINPLARKLNGINLTLLSWLAASLLNVVLSLALLGPFKYNGILVASTLTLFMLILSRYSTVYRLT